MNYIMSFIYLLVFKPASAMGIKITDRITLKNNLCGIVRYIGKIEGKLNEWIGIELEDAKGSNDGTVDGKKYFSCEAKHGIFVKYNRLADRITDMNIHPKYTNDESFSRTDFTKSYNKVSTPVNFLNLKDEKNFQNNSLESFNSADKQSNPMDSTFPKKLDQIKRAENLERLNKLKEPDFIRTSDNSQLFSCNESIKYPFVSNNFLTSPSLFDIDMYGENITHNTNVQNEIEKLKTENLGYKKLIEELTKKCNSVLRTIFTSLKGIEKRLSKITISTTTDKERQTVVNLVSQIFEGKESGDKEKINKNYVKFKEIMEKHNIKVD